MAVAVVTVSTNDERLVLNDTVHIAASFTVAGVATDPTAVSLTVTDPAGTATTYTYALTQITKDSTGNYSKDIAASLAGVYSFVYSGTGTAAGVQDGTFTVYDDVPLSLYATLDELKSRYRIEDDDDDVQAQSALEATCGWIDQWCEDFFGRVSATRTFEPTGTYDLEIPSLISVTTLKTDSAGDGTFEQTWTAGTHYQLLPLNPSNGRETKPYTSIRAVGSLTFPSYTSYGVRRDLVQIVGVFGWPAVPAAVREATLILAAETFKLKDAPFGVAGFDQFGAVRVRDNPKALALLQPYRRYPVMVA